MLRDYCSISIRNDTLSVNNIGVITFTKLHHTVVTKLHHTNEYNFQKLNSLLGGLTYCWYEYLVRPIRKKDIFYYKIHCNHMVTFLPQFNTFKC